MKKLIKWIGIWLLVMFGLIVLISMVDNDKDTSESSEPIEQVSEEPKDTQPKETSEPKELPEIPDEEKHEIVVTKARIFIDSLFAKYVIQFTVEINNNDTKNFEPYYDFKLFGPTGSTLDKTSIYEGNDNECSFYDKTIRPGGSYTCTVAFKVNSRVYLSDDLPSAVKGEYELEIYDSIWATVPKITKKYNIEELGELEEK